MTIAEQVNIDFRARADEANISIHNEADAWQNFIPGPKSAEVGFTGLGAVFTGLRGTGQGWLTAGNDALYQVRTYVKRGRALGGVQNAQPPGRAGADVDEPAPRPERVLRELGRPRDRLTLLADRLGHHAVLRIDQIDDAERVQLVDPTGLRVTLLGEPSVAHACRWGAVS